MTGAMTIAAITIGAIGLIVLAMAITTAASRKPRYQSIDDRTHLTLTNKRYGI